MTFFARRPVWTLTLADGFIGRISFIHSEKLNFDIQSDLWTLFHSLSTEVAKLLDSSSLQWLRALKYFLYEMRVEKKKRSHDDRFLFKFLWKWKNWNMTWETICPRSYWSYSGLVPHISYFLLPVALLVGSVLCRIGPLSDLDRSFDGSVLCRI